MCTSTLAIFVHRASECLTDHLPHGEGLIAHTLLRGLAERGHNIFAYTNHDAVRDRHPRLTIRSRPSRSPAHSLRSWEQNQYADRWLKALLQQGQSIDLVWRMYPFRTACPTLPATANRPLVVGPLNMAWPKLDDAEHADSAKPRLGLGLKPLLDPVATRGWNKSLQQASLLISDLPELTRRIQSENPHTNAMYLPHIIDPPVEAIRMDPPRESPIRLAFVGHLSPNKRPMLFCQAVQHLRDRGIAAEASIVGGGPLQEQLQGYLTEQSLGEAVWLRGQMPNREVFELLAGCDFLISTSHGEPYGRTIAEAMSVGAVSICHRSGGPAEIVEHGVDGVLVDDLTPEAFADAVQAAADANRWLTMSRAAKSKAENWRSDVVLKQLEEAFYTVTDKYQKQSQTALTASTTRTP